MNKESVNFLYNKYPKLFRQKDLPASETCMCWGICCGQGWYKIIEDACEKLAALAEAEQVNIEFSQIKEKFGGLRLYIDINTEASPTIDIAWTNSNGEVITIPKKEVWEKANNICGEAENLSFKTCESCSKPGEIRKGNWVICLCDECEAEKYKKGL